MLSRVASSCAFVLTAWACTAFEGNEPTGAGGQGGAGASGQGADGAGPASCVTMSPACLLPELEAHKLCALIGDCPELSAGIALSTGLPLGELAADGTRLGFNYSACVDWLTAPLELAHRGFETASSIFNCLAATTACELAGACLSYERLAAGDPRCATETGRRCEGNDLVDCDAGEVTHCDGLGFPVTTDCDDGADGVPTCRVGPCETAGIACEENLVEYAIACTPEGDEVGVSCTAAGLSCTQDIGCTSPSTGLAPECSTPFAQSCSGTRVVQTCATRTPSALLEAQIDCAKVGLECAAQGASARCSLPAPECTPESGGVNVCDPQGGTSITLCVGGTASTFDCAVLGLACAAAEPGNSARCRIGEP